MSSTAQSRTSNKAPAFAPEPGLRANDPITMRRTGVEEMLKSVTSALGTMIFLADSESALESLDGIKQLYRTQADLELLLSEPGAVS